MTALLRTFCAELTPFTRGGTTDLKTQAKPSLQSKCGGYEWGFVFFRKGGVQGEEILPGQYRFAI